MYIRIYWRIARKNDYTYVYIHVYTYLYIAFTFCDFLDGNDYYIHMYIYFPIPIYIFALI